MRLLGILVLVLGVVGGFWLDNRDGVLFNALRSSTSTPTALEEDGTSKPTSIGSKIASKFGTSPTLSAEEVEKKVEEIYKELDEKEGDLRLLELMSPESPYAGMVTVKRGDAKATDAQREYIIISAHADNATAVEISGWTLESYVTNSESEIPEGARFLKSHTTRTEEPIFLKPGESAYVTTGDTPIKTSFRENICTGYLAEYGSFYPSLKKECPLPPDELLQFSSVKSSDDNCAEFVNDIKRCEIVDDNEIDAENLSSSCRSFINNVLDYEGCVAKHDNDPHFYTSGAWRIYLDESRELWRSTREIIRLLDTEERVVGIIEY